MKALYCTADKIGTGTGGGIVTENELAALRSVADEITVLSHDELDPTKYGQPDIPFLSDYFALEQIKDKQFDLAHFNSGTFTQTVRWLKSRGTRIVYTCPYHDRQVTIEEFNRLGLEYPWPHISNNGLWNIFFGGCIAADVVVAPSKLSAKGLEAEGCHNVTVIPHGVTIPEKVEPLPDSFDVSYLGAYGPDKAIIYLIQAWDKLNQGPGPGPGWPASRLILAGRQSELLEPMLRGVAARGNFCLLGYVESPSQVYNACSVYIQPSVVESWGIEVGEAMAHGRPVIVSDGAGACEMVSDGADGFVVEKRDVEAIATKLQWFRDNRDRIPEMGKKARRKAERYSWEHIQKQYIKLWSAAGN